MSRRMGLLRNLYAPRSKPKMASLYFWWPSRATCCVAMVELPGFYLKSTVPTASWEMNVVFESGGYACLSCSFSLSVSEHPLVPPPLP
jgi:hypothetical protein